MRRHLALPMNMLLLFAVVLAGGCTSYYQIRDPDSGRTYYTDDMKTLEGGAVRFTDAQTGNEVTIQDSSVEEISEDEFNIRRYQPPAPAGDSGGEAK
jgi:hypothetical protein